MILEEETFREFGYLPGELKPQSHKKILAACGECGLVRAIRKDNYHALCKSCAHKVMLCSEETRRKLREAKKGKNHPFFGKHHSEETKRKQSKAKKGKFIGEKSPNWGTHPSEETRQKMSEAHKKNWQDPDYIKKVFDGLNMKPNAQEKKVGAILQKHLPNEYAYNGDFSCGITIGGKIPDFVNVNGEKVVIEVFGPWHDEQYMRDHFGGEISWKRTEFGTKVHYSQFGYKCVVFWQEDLERKDVEAFVLSELKKYGIAPEKLK